MRLNYDRQNQKVQYIHPLITHMKWGIITPKANIDEASNKTIATVIISDCFRYKMNRLEWNLTPILIGQQEEKKDQHYV